MAVIFLDSFDHYTTAQMTGKWDLIQTGVIQSAVTRCNVGQAYQAGPNGFGLIQKNLPSQTTYTVGFGMYMIPDAADQVGILRFNDGTGSDQIKLLMHADNTFYATRGATTIGTSTYIFPAAAWHYLEVKLHCDASTGTFDVLVDNVNILSFSGNTKNASTTNIGMVQVTNDLHGATTEVFVDDLYICDTTNADGAGNTGFLGPQKVVPLFPRAAGSNSGFTPTPTQANYLNVKENLPGNDGDTSYNAAASDGLIDSFPLDTIPFVAGTITAAQGNLVGRYDDGGPHVFQGYNKSGSATALSANISSPSNYGTSLLWVQEIDPNTGAKYSVANFNLSEWGYKRLS